MTKSKTPTAPTIAWRCQECGRKFRAPSAARHAMSVGCPHCGGTDIDLTAPILGASDEQVPS